MSAVLGGGVALILIVEEQVRVLAEGVLLDYGYKTLSAATTDQALALVEGGEKIYLLFTDIGLQSDLQAGLVLAQEVTRKRPQLPAVQNVLSQR